MAIAWPVKQNEDGSRGLDLTSRQKTGLGAGAFLAFSAIVLAVWGSTVEFPVKIGRNISEAIDSGIRFITTEGDFILDPTSEGVLRFLLLIKDFFEWVPWPILIVAVTIVSVKTAGKGVGVFSVIALSMMGALGLWDSAMETMALIVVAVVLSIAIAVPLGIFAARSDSFDSVMRPVLDGMQTMPSFVYLVPAVMFFGIGDVPAIFATIIYAVPPAIRLTNLGIRQVSADIVEAALSFGTTPRQLLMKVQIPMAVPTIMAGINQTIMMALAMVVIASLVGAGGLGEDVNRALNRFQPGQAFLAGLGIVFLAIIIDRITQAAAKERQKALMGDQH
ncbi:MAG: proline/glycine betaine ABC transporter permease [Chloroflexi bacterium]|nr:proline/glycine betaine ABC transporter permease [Chloroflexota bacterium]